MKKPVSQFMESVLICLVFTQYKLRRCKVYAWLSELSVHTPLWLCGWGVGGWVGGEAGGGWAVGGGQGGHV